MTDETKFDLLVFALVVAFLLGVVVGGIVS